MREEIEILTALQNLDREIKEKSEVRLLLSADIKKNEEEVKSRKEEAETLRAEWAAKEKLRQEKEQVLQDEGKKAMEKRMRMNRIKNIKELQALQREIDQIKQSNAQLEEELLKVLEESEGVSASLREKESELNKLEEEWKGKQAEIEGQLVEIDKAVAAASLLRGDIAAKVDGELIERYELIFSRRGGTAVVGVSDGICQGCHMNIRPQLWNEIIKSEKIIHCPSCHRILYYSPTIPEDKQL